MRGLTDPEAIGRQEFCERFAAGMRERMVASYFKYGPVEESQGKVDYMKSMHQRLKSYDETGNTEFLMDAANFLMIEFMFPRHPAAYFAPTDSRESPGRVDVDGQRTFGDRNADIDPEETRRRREASDRALQSFRRERGD